jgi:hypothetical protein
MARGYAHTVDTATQAFDRAFAFGRLLQVRLPNGQITAARQALARVAGVPVTGDRAARCEIMLHLSGFPDSAGAHRAARVIAAEGRPENHFWVGALAIGEGRWTDVEAARQALEQQAQGFNSKTSPPGANDRAYSAAYAAALGAYAGLVRGDRSRLAAFESALARLPGAGWQLPQQYLRYRVGKLLFDEARRATQSGTSELRPYGTSTPPAELYCRIAEAGTSEEAQRTTAGSCAVAVRRRPLRPLWEGARR